MNMKRLARGLFGFCLLLASCSKDDGFTNSPAGNDGGTVDVTFTATVDYSIRTAGGAAEASTRATANEDDDPTRFYAQAVKKDDETKTEMVQGESVADGKYSFNITGLEPDAEYDFLFWADNGEEAVSDLTAVPYTAGTIAFAAKETGTYDKVTTDITLKHVVAKVTLKSTTDVTMAYGNIVSLSTQCASKYNVQTLSASTFMAQTASKDEVQSITADEEVLTTYFIPNPDEQTVTIGAHSMTMTLADIPLAANTHVTLQGDLSTGNSEWRNPPAALMMKHSRRFSLKRETK